MGQRRPTLFNIAKLSCVSQPRESRAISGNPSVSAKTRAPVLAAVERFQHKVDQNASGLRRQHSRTLALQYFEYLSLEDLLKTHSICRCRAAWFGAAPSAAMICLSRSSSSRRIGARIMETAKRLTALSCTATAIIFFTAPASGN